MSGKIDVNKLSKMAKFNVSSDEATQFEARAEFLVEDFKKLTEVDTKDVNPLIYASELTNVIREDKVIKTISREALLANAPDSTEEYFRVPKTVE